MRQSFGSLGQRFYWPAWGFVKSWSATSQIPGSTDVLLDAAGEYVHQYGSMCWSDGGSHTVSAAGGGVIGWRCGSTATWTDGTAEFQIGIQDLSATMNPLRGDGSPDVYRSMTTATDTITTNTFFESVMNNGTKTIAHGDYVVIAMDCIAGSATGRITCSANENTSPGNSYPGATMNQGTPTLDNLYPFYVIADDGTVGWIEGTFPLTSSSETYADATNPDERGMVFQVPHAIEVSSLAWYGGHLASDSIARLRLYSDPLGTPVALATATVDSATHYAGTSTTIRSYNHPITPQLLVPGVDYCMAVKATGAGNIKIGVVSAGSAELVDGFFSSSIAYYTRNGDSGAFGSADGTKLPVFGLGCSAVYPRSGPSFNLGI